MDYIELLAWYVPVLSIAFVLLLTSINVYMRIRRRFAITVNCWFCQRNARVAYDSSNSWHCPHCDQYNGFTADGDYNREIPAQRVAKMNAGRFARGRQPQQANDTTTPATSNGLCAPCNLNQELKVQQLAAFEPLHPHDDYDTAIERYQQQLEQAYRLCARCERHLRRRLTRVKRTVLGSKLAQIGARGLSAFDMHISEMSRRRGVRVTTKRRRLARLCAATLIVLAALAAWRTGGEVQLTRTRLNRVLPDAVTRGVFVVYALLRTLGMCVRTAVERLWSGTAMRTVAEAWLAIRLWMGAGELSDIVAEMDGKVPLPAAFDADQTHCVAALMLCLLVAWVNRFRGGSLAVLIAWSVKSVLPWVAGRLIADSAAESADSAAYASVVMDIVRVAVDAVMVCTTVRDAVRRPQSDVGNTSSSRCNTSAMSSSHTNSSFHRIYTEADAGEVSDDNDNDTVFSASTTRSSSGGGSPGTRSLDSTLSLSPSVFTPRTLRHSNTMLTSSVRSLNMSFGAETSAAAAPLIRVPSLATSMAGGTAATPGRYHSMQALNSMYDVPDDFQSGITQLNISGFYPDKLNRTATVVSSAAANRSFAGTAAATRFGSYDQLRHRNGGCGSIIGPARLNAPSTIHESTTTTPSANAVRSSWIAGGYWAGNNSSTSPTKRSAEGPGVAAAADSGAAAPLMSRTSSQSSGFESRNDNDSRESSVGPSAAVGASATFASLAGDVLGASISPNDSVSQCGVGPWAEPPYQPSVVASAAPNSMQYERFGTHRRSVAATTMTAVAAAGKQRWGAPPALPVQQQHRAQSVFEPGSLLRSWQLRTSQLDISGRT